MKCRGSWDSLQGGCIVTFQPARVRVRMLPIGTHEGDECCSLSSNRGTIAWKRLDES